MFYYFKEKKKNFFFFENLDESEEEALERIQKERMKTARKILAERRKCDRSVSVPVVPKEK